MTTITDKQFEWLQKTISQMSKDITELKKEKRSTLSVVKNETWVKVSVITDLTGWDATYLKKARRNELIKARLNETGGYDYLLESLRDEFKIKKAG